LTTKSSAWGIPYEIRPSKQVERRLVMETILLAREAGLKTRAMPFVGMGGVRFIDFLLAHKILGTDTFVTLEHDETLWNRCELNRPFESIDLYKGSASDFLNERGFREPSIVWFDLEKMASKDARDDVVSAATSVKPGSFLFVTATAEMPRHFTECKSMDRRLVAVKEEFYPLAGQLPVEWVQKNEFFRTSAFLAMAFLRFGFNGRSDGHFSPLVNIAYRDSNWMVTVGGFFGEQAVAEAIQKKVLETMPFACGLTGGTPFPIEQFNMTDLERGLFDRAVSASTRKRSAKNQIKSLGFRDSVYDQYKQLMRFIPRYVETAL
jgi:hypothetical protein